MARKTIIIRDFGLFLGDDRMNEERLEDFLLYQMKVYFHLVYLRVNILAFSKGFLGMR